jgi:hypothetical protein
MKEFAEKGSLSSLATRRKRSNGFLFEFSVIAEIWTKHFDFQPAVCFCGYAIFLNLTTEKNRFQGA